MNSQLLSKPSNRWMLALILAASTITGGAAITGESFSGELRGTVREIGLEVSRQEIFNNQPGENLDQRVVKVRIHLNPEDSKRVAGLTNLQVQVAIQP